MNKIGKLIGLLLALCAILCGCGEAASEASPATETTVPTEATTEAPTQPPITSEEALRQAMETEHWITMDGDISLTAEVLLGTRMFNGGGYTLTGMPHVKDDETTENALVVTGGSIEDLRITGAYCCVRDTSEYPIMQDLRIKNLYADSDKIALTISKGNRTAALFVEDSTLLGWTLVNKLRTAQFTNCTFGWSTNNSGGHFRAYVDSTLIGCRFEGRTKNNGDYVPFNISFYSSTSGVTVTLEDCYVGDTLITEENMHTLLKINDSDNYVRVYNTTN